MPDIPAEAIRAAARAAAACNVRWKTAIDDPATVARAALEAAAPFIVSAERATGNDEHHVRMADFWDRIIGFRAGGRVYHPSDVEIVMKSPEESR